MIVNKKKSLCPKCRERIKPWEPDLDVAEKKKSCREFIQSRVLDPFIITIAICPDKTTKKAQTFLSIFGDKKFCNLTLCIWHRILNTTKPDFKQ